jgi:hypothetical protein
MFVPGIDDRCRAAAFDLIGTGLSDYEISRKTGVSRSSVQRWRTLGLPTGTPSQCPTRWLPPNPARYSYLLGIYLGDGYVSKASESPVLEISLDSRYPGIARECAKAIWDVAQSRSRIHLRSTAGGTSIRVTAGSRLWPLAFPQHGPGKKHLRPIALTKWQQGIVDRHPKPCAASFILTARERSIAFLLLYPAAKGNMPTRAISSQISRPISAVCFAPRVSRLASAGPNPAKRTSPLPIVAASSCSIRSSAPSHDAGGGT